MNRKVSFAAVAHFMAQLTDEESRTLVAHPREVKAFLGSLMKKAEEATFVTALNDSDVPVHLQQTVVKWRRYAAELGYTGPVVWRVKAGFTVKRHAPLAGPCYEKFDYLESWFFSDDSTVASIVFWVPRIAPDSISKNVEEQMKLLTNLRQRHELPTHHLTSFGSVALVSGLILAHFKRTGERIPLDCLWVRTDTRDVVGDRLSLGGFDESGLDCDAWLFGESGCGYGCLGVFALGVELE